MLSELIFPILIMIIATFSINQYNDWVKKLAEDQLKLAKEQNKLLNDIKTQLMILNATNRKNDS